MERGAWKAAVHGVAEGRTRMSDFTFTFHFSLSCIGEGNGNPLQCSCLENPRDWGAWWADVCGVAQSWTQLKRLSSSSSLSHKGSSADKESACNAGDLVLIPGLRRSPGEGKAAQPSILAWRIHGLFHGVAKSRT